MSTIINETEYLLEYMKIGVDSFQDAEDIFLLTTKYFNELKEEDYNIENATLAEGFINKMMSIALFFDLDEEIINSLETSNKNFIANIAGANKNAKIQFYNKVIAASMKFHNSMVALKPKNQLNFGTFQPQKSDKSLITLKISEAIEMINSSEILTDKVRSKLTEMLDSVISELHKPKTDWGVYFTKVNYVIMFLGSLGSIASGGTGINQLYETKAKLEEANTEFQSSSLSLSKKDIKDVFVLNDNLKIDPKETLKIEKSISKKN